MSVRFKASFTSSYCADDSKFHTHDCFGGITDKQHMEDLSEIIIETPKNRLDITDDTIMEETLKYLYTIPSVEDAKRINRFAGFRAELVFEPIDSTLFKFLMMCLVRELTCGFSTEKYYTSTTYQYYIKKNNTNYKPLTALGLVAHTTCNLHNLQGMQDNLTWQVAIGKDSKEIDKINSFWGLYILYNKSDYGNWYMNLNDVQSVNYFTPDFLETTPTLVSLLQAEGL